MRPEMRQALQLVKDRGGKLAVAEFDHLYAPRGPQLREEMRLRYAIEHDGKLSLSDAGARAFKAPAK